jgi:hypothetical protein
MKNKKTYYLLILDKSGSMQSCVNETIGGFNEQLLIIWPDTNWCLQEPLKQLAADHEIGYQPYPSH